METRHITFAIVLISMTISYFPRSTLAAIYAQALNLDFLCSAVETNAYVRDVPWDCASYVICISGQAVPTSCPQGKLYASANRNSKCVPSHHVDPSRCHRRIWEYITNICQANPWARVPNSEGCSHYFDCSALSGGQDFMNYVVECPYPTLFSKLTGGCRDYRFVYCGERTEPKAPCEYLQYMQMYDCRGPNCVKCNQRHPSCVGRLNGPHYVPQRNDVMMECSDERTVKIIRTKTSPSSYPSSSSSSPSSSSSSASSSLPATPSASTSRTVVTSSDSVGAASAPSSSSKLSSSSSLSSAPSSTP